MGVDALDIRILRTMGVQPYGARPRSPATLQARHVAAALGVSPETVRDRVQRMERSGVICGYELFPNTRHFGLSSTLFFARFRDEAEAEAAVERVAPMEGLTATYAFLGPTVGLDLAYRGPQDLERKLRLLRALVPGAEVARIADIPMPPVKRSLTGLDWRILQALRGAATRPLGEVAARVGVSARTVKRRFDRMAAEGSFFVIPVVDPSAVPGLILFEILFDLDPALKPDAIRGLHAALDENLVCVDAPTEPGSIHYAAGLYAAGIGEVDRLRRLAAAVPGVRRAEPMILRGSIENYSWLDEAIAAQVDAARAATPAHRGP